MCIAVSSPPHNLFVGVMPAVECTCMKPQVAKLAYCIMAIQAHVFTCVSYPYCCAVHLLFASFQVHLELGRYAESLKLLPIIEGELEDGKV